MLHYEPSLRYNIIEKRRVKQYDTYWESNPTSFSIFQNKLTYNKHSINFKLNELNYLLANIATLGNQLSGYSIAQNDVISYVTNAIGSELYLQPSTMPIHTFCTPYCMMKLVLFCKFFNKYDCYSSGNIFLRVFSFITLNSRKAI